MPAINVRVDRDLYTQLKAQKPHFLSDAAYLNLVISQAVDTGFRLGKPTPPQGAAVLPSNQSNKEELNTSKAVNSNACALFVEEKISPRQAGTNPRLNGYIKDLPEELKPHGDLIRDFWRVKKGSKGDRAWSLLQTGLKAIQAADGDDAVKQQLELAINAKWASITFANYEQFKPKPKPWEKEPETKHPAYKVFKASDQGSEWDIPSATGGKGVLDPGAFDQTETEACPF